MKTLFIHLSDLHLTKENSNRINVDTIVENLRDKIEKANHIFLLFTGDFTSEANLVEFNLFESLLDDLKQKISQISLSAEIKVLLTPGNHDLDLSGEENEGYLIDLKKRYSKDDLDNLSEASISKMSCALTLCKKFGTFLKDNYIDNYSLENEDIIYHFTIINSAPLSSKSKIDKEHHHIPAKSLETICQNLKIGKRTIEIVLSHHRPDWFDYVTASKLNDHLYKYSSLAFFGHEHEQGEKTINAVGNSVTVVQGGELIDKEKSLLGSFNTLIFDTDSFSSEYGKYCYNESLQGWMYEEISSSISLSLFKKYKNNQDFLDKNFTIRLKDHYGLISDLFVMPTLYKDDKPKISTTAQLLDYLTENKEIYIKGNAKCGKTALLKYLYLELSKQYVPLFLRCSENISPIVKNAIDHAFVEQYEGGTEKLKMFDALGKKHKAILIDNIHVLKKEIMEKVMAFAREHYELVIVSYTSSYDPTKRLIEESILGLSHLFELLSFSYLNRKRFVNNVCRVMQLDEDKYDKVFKAYEATIGTSKILDFGDPEYALLLIESIISNNYYEDRNTESAFSIAFTHSVKNAFIDAQCDNKLDNCIQLTSWLAREVWKKQGDFSFKERFINDAFNDCCDYYKNITLGFFRYFELLKNSQLIICTGEDTYRFRRPTYLSYFAGQQISSDYHRNGGAEVNSLFENINSGINSDVLLFVCYELKDKSLLERIDNYLDNLCSNVEPLDFNSKNNAILKSVGDEDVSLLEEISFTKEEYEKEKDEREKVSFPAESKKENDSKNISSNYFDVKALKLIEIMSKALSGFSTLLNGDERTKYMKSTINASLRIVQVLFTINNEQYTQMLNILETIKKEIIKLSNEDPSLEKMRNMVSSLTLEGILFNYLTSVVTSFEYSISSWMSSGVSIPIIDGLDDQKITNSLFRIFSYVHMGSFVKYKNLLNKCLKEYADNRTITVLFSSTVISYILQNTISISELKELSQVAKLRFESLKKVVPQGQITYANK